jgi:hypothetical protein
MEKNVALRSQFYGSKKWPILGGQKLRVVFLTEFFIKGPILFNNQADKKNWRALSAALFWFQRYCYIRQVIF